MGTRTTCAVSRSARRLTREADDRAQPFQGPAIQNPQAARCHGSARPAGEPARHSASSIATPSQRISGRISNHSIPVSSRS